MTNYLISFPSATMRLSPGDVDHVVESSHQVIRDAKAAGVYVFSGGLNCEVVPVAVHEDGSKSKPTSALDGGCCILELTSRLDAEQWAARMARGCRTPQELREFHDDPES